MSKTYAQVNLLNKKQTTIETAFDEIYNVCLTKVLWNTMMSGIRKLKA